MDFRGKKIYISVISDLVTDQRVHRTAYTLRGQGASVVLVGRRLSSSLPMSSRAYRTIRLKLFFQRGPMMYAWFNIRLFFFLLFKKADLLVANDLDTLLANFLVSKIRRIPLVYDSHEYFTEVPELVSRPFVQRFWKLLERSIFPKLKAVFTVNDSIADLYEKEYQVKVHVVRNIPLNDQFNQHVIFHELTREEAGLPVDRTIYLLQGSGINIHRGAEEAVEAMKWVDDALLLIIGGGDVIDILKKMTLDLGLSDKVKFVPKMPPTELRKWTRLADFGLTLDKDTNLNYRYSLPNKLFDYIESGLPVITTDLPEVRRIVELYDIGRIVPTLTPQYLADVMNHMKSPTAPVGKWKENVKIAAAEISWDQERERLLAVFDYA